jgi:hypothetical protein
MKIAVRSARTPRRSPARLPSLLGCAATLALLAPASAALGAASPETGSSAAGATAGVATAGSSGQGGSAGSPTATLEQCATSAVQTERSATFAGEMTATAGTARMSIRIDVQERRRGELVFHTVIAPGLGVWRVAAPGVKVYRYLKQVTDLAAPALYRAAIRFRWLNAKGKLMRGLERRTPSCLQPVSPGGETPPTTGA